MMKRRTNFLLYLVLNIFVSAATTLAVLYAWDHYFKAELAQADLGPLPTAVSGLPQGVSTISAAEIQSAVTLPPAPLVTATLPPLDPPLIQFYSVVGAGDLEQEVVLLKRVGPGNLGMVGWQLTGEGGLIYTFPAQPELILYTDGAVQVHSKPGEDTATDVYWNRSEAAWRAGEVIRLLDSLGQERATYRVP